MSQLPHELFDLSSIGSQRTLHVIRQDRCVIEEEKCQMFVPDGVLDVIDFSTFGIAAKSKIALLLETEIREVPLVFEEVLIAKLHVKVVRCEPMENKLYKIAFEIMGEPIHMERVIAVKETQKVLTDHEQRFQKLEVIPEAVRVIIYQLKDWFEELQERVNSLSEKLSRQEGNQQVEFENAIVPIVGSYLGKEFPKHYKKLENPLKSLSGEARKQLVELFRTKLCDLIHQSPFAHRVYHKPLGYAGDYEMMNLIYRSDTRGHSLFARCLEYYSVREPAAQAVRNRARYLEKKIADRIKKQSSEPIRFLSVACGPSQEWTFLMNEHPEFLKRKLKIDLLDQDKEALKYAQKSIKEAGIKNPHNYDFHFIHKAIKNLIARGIENEKYDLIYCAGLFDYLSDPVAQLAALKLYHSLRPGGQLIIGNFNVANPNEIIMDLALDWHLIYRSKNDLQTLFESIGGDLHIESEDLEINLFCILTRR